MQKRGQSTFDDSLFDPDLIESRNRRRRKKRRQSCLSKVFLFLFIFCFIAVIVCVVLLLSRGESDKPVDMAIAEGTPWFEQGAQLGFYSPTPSLTYTASSLPDTPTPTPTAAVEILASDTSQAVLAEEQQQSTVTPALTPTALLGLPTVENLHGTPDSWYVVMGTPGAVNADSVYTNAACSWMGVAGVIVDERNRPVEGVRIRVGGFADGSIRETLSGLFPVYGDSGFELTLMRPVQPIAEMLWIQIFDDDGTPLSNKTYFRTSDNCEKSLILINYQKVK